MIDWKRVENEKPPDGVELLVCHEPINEYNVAQLINGEWWSTVAESGGSREPGAEGMQEPLTEPVTHWAELNRPEDKMAAPVRIFDPGPSRYDRSPEEGS